MVVDCFTFFNEKFQLLCRLNELDLVVDKFVIVESAWTQRRNEKPYFLDEWILEPEFAQFVNKIIRVKVEEKVDGGGNFGHDIFQRNQIVKGLNQLNLSSEDVILVSDVDEIPKAELVKNLVIPPESFVTFQLGYYCYYANLRVLDQNRNNFRWNGTVAVRPEMFNRFTPHQIIKFRDYVINQNASENLIENSGWHLSYLSKSVCYNKYFATCEPFSVDSIPPQDIFDEVWTSAARPDGNFIFCDNLENKTLPLSLVSLDTLPKYLQDNQEKYKEIIWRE